MTSRKKQTVKDNSFHGFHWNGSEEEKALVEKISAFYGEPFRETPNRVSINHAFFAEYIIKHCNLAYGRNAWWEYNASNGLWVPWIAKEISGRIEKEILILGRLMGVMAGSAINSGVLRSIRDLMSSVDAPSLGTPREGVIHVENGMLEIKADGTMELKAFSSDYWSTKQIHVAYDANAQCPKFLGKLLKPVVEAGDITTLQSYVGQCLLGTNITQHILYIHGAAGSGKSVAVSLFQKMIGGENVSTFRPEGIGGRFESSAYVGKSLLTGMDIPADTLTKSGSSCLKALTGGDRIETECKGEMSAPLSTERLMLF